MRLAIGLIVSPGFTVPTEFWIGRPMQQVASATEGYLAILQRLQSGEINHHLPAHLQLTGMRQITSRKFPTDCARNEICADVLAGDEDYLLFLDADMVHPLDTVERLIQAEAALITGRYHQKKPPFAAVAYVKHRTQDGPHRYAAIHYGRGVFEIERGGAGVLLIHRSVLQAIKDKVGPNWFRYQRGPEPPHDFSVSEDFWFWQQARECGFKGYIDWDLECQHLTQMAIDSSWNTPFLTAQVGAFTDPDKRDLVVDNTIVCGYPDGLILDEHTRVPAYEVTAGER